jgi:exopolyphosphatase/guanosine-5'-triphosphate,3'-diphosphate pyrophosphatase
MIRASIDIGSNSVLLLVGEFDENSNTLSNEILNLSFVTSLGKDLDKTKQFHPDSMKATYEALTSYKTELEKIKFKPEDVLVTATEASRVATNAKEFYKKIKDELGFSVTLISAEGEAYYTALGVASGLKEDEEVVIMDMGGASTELIRVKLNPFQIHDSISLPVGSVRATDWRKDNSFEKKMHGLLNRDLSYYNTKTLLGVAGSMTSLATMYMGKNTYSDQAIDGMNMNFNSFKEFTLDLQNTTIENLLLLFPYLGKRAPMLAAGATVAKMIGEKLNIEKIQISTRGLRYGVLVTGSIDQKFRIRE